VTAHPRLCRRAQAVILLIKQGVIRAGWHGRAKRRTRTQGTATLPSFFIWTGTDRVARINMGSQMVRRVASSDVAGSLLTERRRIAPSTTTRPEGSNDRAGRVAEW
jgi:hypothetical protein